MATMVAKVDSLGKPAWLILMVLGFILFWPIGLAILAYMLWSRRMGCEARWNRMSGDQNWNPNGSWEQGGRWERPITRRQERWEHKMSKFQETMNRWGANRQTFKPTGNQAFDLYREDTIRNLEEEATAFQDFLARLRMARDKEEFDQYMSDRRKGSTDVAPDPSASPN